MDKRTAFITGGTGFVGMNIAERLLGHGWDVILYARKKPDGDAVRELKVFPGRIHIETGDVLDQQRMEDILEKYGVDYFIHGAAMTPDEVMEKEYPASVVQVNCMGVLYGLLAARNKGIRRFLYLGSISAYGNTAFEGKPLVEGTSVGKPHSLYELTKYMGEHLVLRMGELYGLDAYVARIGDVYGPWERYTGVRSHMSLIYQTTAKAVKGEKAYLPRPCLQDWVSGPDIAGETLALLEAGKLNYKIYPFCSGSRWTLVQWCRLLKKRYPGFSYEIAEKSCQVNIHVNQKEDNAPMSLERLKEDTGYSPICRTPEEAFECYMKWLEGHGHYLG